MSCACGQHRSEGVCKRVAALVAWRTANPERLRQMAREAGRANAVIDRQDVVNRYLHLDREDAIWQAWRDARRIAKYQRYRARRRAK